MARLDRILSLLDTFADGTAVSTAEQISQRTGFPIATTYRYIRELTDAGLMVRLPQGYAPGPRIIEWDCMIREGDPLLACSRGVIAELVADTGLELLLSQLYGDKVVNVHYEHSSANPLLHFGRGRVMPLFRGSTSRVILAAMPARQLRRLYDANEAHPDVQRFGAGWKAFHRALAEVRQQGYAISSGELDATKVGIAAPIFGEGGRALASLTLISSTQRFRMFRADYIAERVVEGARRITRLLDVKLQHREAA